MDAWDSLLLTCRSMLLAAAVQRTGEGQAGSQAGMVVFPICLFSVVAEEEYLFTVVSAACCASLFHTCK